MNSTVLPVLHAKLKRLVWIAAAIVIVLMQPLTISAGSAVPFRASFQGSFSILFGTGPGGTNELSFVGDGQAIPLGHSTVDGHTTTRNISSTCTQIVTDAVTLTAANGDQLQLVNAGQDCLDFSVPGKTFIRGTGTTSVVGGTGRFAAASGSGTWEVVAEVTQPIVGGVSGVFTLNFMGAISY